MTANLFIGCCNLSGLKKFSIGRARKFKTLCQLIRLIAKDACSKQILRWVLFALFLCPNLEATRYPIVLIHGLFGFSDSIGFLSYWGDIPKELEKLGSKVYLVSLSHANDSETRALQLHAQLKSFGHEKYHLIGHSQGGIDARYILKHYPDMVASVATIGSPHHGSHVADALVDEINGGFFGFFLPWVGDALSAILSLLTGNTQPENSHEALLSLTQKSMVRFNQSHPAGMGNYCTDGPPVYRGIPLYSWGSHGTSSDTLDLVGNLFKNFSSLLFSEPNDGLVALCSMKFGKWLGEIPDAHHLIPVGGVISQVTEEQKKQAYKFFSDYRNLLTQQGL